MLFHFILSSNYRLNVMKTTRCSICGNEGHNKSSNKCPMYNTESAVRLREEKARQKDEKKREEDEETKRKTEELRNLQAELEAQRSIC